MINFKKLSKTINTNTAQFNIILNDCDDIYAVAIKCSNNIVDQDQRCAFLGIDYEGESLQELYNFLNNNAEDSTDNITDLNTTEEAKESLIAKLNGEYSKAITIYINNKFCNFSVNLDSLEGKKLLQIITIANSHNEEFEYTTQDFFINIEENKIIRVIGATLYNWVWRYIFGHLSDYKHGIDLEFDAYLNQINIATNTIDLNNIDINFSNSKGLKIDVDKITKYILENSEDPHTHRQFPKAVQDAIVKSNGEIFSFRENLTDLTNSWFNA